MREVGAFEAKNRLGTLLDWVEHGEEVIITRRGKAVARLVPEGPRVDREAIRETVRQIREMRHGVTLGGLNVKDVIGEGRR